VIRKIVVACVIMASASGATGPWAGATDAAPMKLNPGLTTFPSVCTVKNCQVVHLPGYSKYRAEIKVTGTSTPRAALFRDSTAPRCERYFEVFVDKARRGCYRSAGEVPVTSVGIGPGSMGDFSEYTFVVRGLTPGRRYLLMVVDDTGTRGGLTDVITVSDSSPVYRQHLG